MTPSKYQQAFFDAVGTSNDNLTVDAVAGSGKSTSVEHAIGYLNQTKSTAIFAFNRAIVEAMKRRMERSSIRLPFKLHIDTINAFGWSICRKATRITQVSAGKDDEILKSIIEKKDFYKYKGVMTRLVALLKANCHFNEDLPESMIHEYMDVYGIDFEVDGFFVRTLQDLWAISSKIDYILNFSDQIYMPLKMGWNIPQFDVGFVDEVQDLNPAQQELMLRACKRFIGVGDSRQAIYAFAGADAHSLKNMIQRTAARILPLSISYRCPKNVVKLAQEIVPHMEFAENASDGIVDSVKNLDLAKDGDFVLCRTNAPLVSSCLQMIREGRKAQVKGKEIGEQLIGLINRLGVKDNDSSGNLLDAVSKYQIEEGERLARANRDQLIEALEDRCETIRVLIESSPTVAGVKDRIRGIFADNVIGIMHSSIHKAKGLESSRVFILREDLLPPKAKRKNQTATQLEQEWNLKYVAITRSMSELYFVRP